MKISLQLDGSRRPPQHNVARKHEHVQSILKLLEASIAESIKSVNDLKVSTEKEVLALLYEANIFSNDMQRIVHNLQKIAIKSLINGVFDPKLEAAVKEISRFAYSVQQCFSDDLEILKSQITENLSKIMPQARLLVESVQENNNPEFIHEIVAVVDDLLYAVENIEYRNKLEGDNPDNIIIETTKLRDSSIEKLNSFKHINHSVLRDIKHAAREGIAKNLIMVKNLIDKADNYIEDISKVLLHSSYRVMRVLAELDSGIRSKSDVNAIKCYMIICVSEISLQLENLTELLKIKIEDKQVANNLHNLVMLVIVSQFCSAEKRRRNLDLTKNQISDD